MPLEMSIAPSGHFFAQMPHLKQPAAQSLRICGLLSLWHEQWAIAPFVSFPCSDESVCDFITNKKGSLKNILKSLDVLVSNHIGFTLNVVVSKANISYLLKYGKRTKY